MDSEFDKEIDAILRNARHDGPVLVGDASRHLDADQISAFAENAMTEKSRLLYAAHMADCDRCRKILSNVLVMNSEAVPATATSPSAITIAERTLPWYSSLFSFPNLAYVMGSLVIIFGGFLAFSVFQGSNELSTAKISEQPAAAPATTEGGPRYEPEDAYPHVDASANSAANAAIPSAAPMSANSNANSTAGTSPGGPRVVGVNNFALDGTASAGDSTVATIAPPASAAATQPLAKDKEAGARDDVALAQPKPEAKANEPTLQDSAKYDAKMKQQAGTPVQSGPMRNNEAQINRQYENMEAQRKRSTRDADDNRSGRKVVGGRTFEKKDGVWYDIAYQGRPTINVRRGSDEFNRLDGGLRSIANSLSGTIVVVWGAKAYRIQ